MKKFFVIYILLLLLVSLLTGCEKENHEQTGIQVYYTDDAAARMETENYLPKASGGEAMIEELIMKLSDKPLTSSFKKAVPDGIGITSYVFQEKNLKVDFNGTYSEMDPVTEVFCRAAVVKTLVQVPEVDTVEFTVNGQNLTDSRGNEIGPMNEESFIDTKGEGINSYQFSVLTLSFADRNGENLVKEMRSVHYSSNTSLEKVIVEELIKGPENEELLSVIPEDVQIQIVSTENQICKINLSTFNNKVMNQNGILPEVILYAIVNSICENTDMTTVEFQINGNTEEKFCNQMDLNQKFFKNDRLYKEDSGSLEEKKKPTVGVDPSLQ